MPWPAQFPDLNLIERVDACSGVSNKKKAYKLFTRRVVPN